MHHIKSVKCSVLYCKSHTIVLMSNILMKEIPARFSVKPVKAKSGKDI